MMMTLGLLGLMSQLSIAQIPQGAMATPDELAVSARWVASKFDGVADTVPVQPGLLVLMNYGPVQQNSRDGNPLKIADTQYTHGLFTHAVSRIAVRLPGPGKAFSAVVGIDTNGSYSGGTAVFSVNAAGKDLFTSKIMTRGEPGVALNVDLDGATEFFICVGDGGDNINSDQASWADAKVVLADETELRLGDMQIAHGGNDPFDATPPFSFVYDGQSSSDFLKSWTLERSKRVLDDARTEHSLSYTNQKKDLVVRCVGVEYKEYPTIEWTIYFKNIGQANTPIIENIKALDTVFQRSQNSEFLLHHFIGSVCEKRDYEPIETPLKPTSKKRITTNNGRPTNSDMPYFNIEMGGKGIIAVIGWAGQWAADFERDEALNLRISGGQELTHFVLYPGEEVRGPMVVLQFYEGDWIRSQNVWRRWMFAYNTPRPNGQQLKPQISCCNGNHFPNLMCNAADEMTFLRRYAEEKIQLDYWWQDAGWYPCDGVGWPKTGTWEVEKKRFPKGLREVSDLAHSQGVKTIVWFEPERVHPDTWITENHPEWVHGGKNGGLLKLGDPDCRKWLTDHIDKILTDEGIDLYRQDFNIDPLSYWRAADTEDRQGITEIRHIEGYFAYWDEIQRRHPGMFFDSCASGGRRNDIETLRRAVPLLRSDYTFEPIGEQCHTYGMSFWIPFNGTGFIEINEYLVRSLLAMELTVGPDMRRTDLDYDLLRRLVNEWRQVKDFFSGDYYPLTKYSLENDVWMAWQFDRPDLGEGMVQVFRRGDSFYESARLKVRGLDPNAVYTVKAIDKSDSTEMTGKDLMDTGILVQLPEQPDSAILLYKKVQK